MSELIQIRQIFQRTTDFQDVIEMEKEWYDKFVAEYEAKHGKSPTPHDVWNAAIDEGYDYETEWSEPDWNNETVTDCWIGNDSRGV